MKLTKEQVRELRNPGIMIQPEEWEALMDLAEEAAPSEEKPQLPKKVGGFAISCEREVSSVTQNILKVMDDLAMSHNALIDYLAAKEVEDDTDS